MIKSCQLVKSKTDRNNSSFYFNKTNGNNTSNIKSKNNKAKSILTQNYYLSNQMNGKVDESIGLLDINRNISNGIPYYLINYNGNNNLSNDIKSLC